MGIKRDNPQEFYSALSTWRTSEKGHIPHMTSDLVFKKGWGRGSEKEGTSESGSYGKAVKCSEIPAEYMYSGLVRGDTRRVASATRSVVDEAYDKWAKMCNRLQIDGRSRGIGPTADCPEGFVYQ